MPHIIKCTEENGEDLWEEFGVADIILVSCSATLQTKSVNLIMNGEASEEMLKRFPKIDEAFGRRLDYIKKVRKNYGYLDSGDCHLGNSCLPSFRDIAIATHKTRLGVYQVGIKNDDLAAMFFIQSSLARIDFWKDKYKRIAMNFPGIGRGGLDFKDVYPIVMDCLPDHCWVYYRE